MEESVPGDIYRKVEKDKSCRRRKENVRIKIL